MYKRQITSYACADVPDFDFENVSTEIWTEYQNVVKKFKAFSKMKAICKLNFHEKECVRLVKTN